MILFFYSLLLYVVLILGAPFWLFRMATTQKYRHGLLERLGFVPQRLLDAITGQQVIWLHAVSVGEVLAASRLINELRSRATGCRVVVSTTTRTGQMLARSRFGPDSVFYFPLDLGWALRRYLHALKPALVILVETEFWPNMLNQCRTHHIPIAVVNARISDRSYPRYRRLRRLWRPLLESLTVVLAQSEEDARRLKAIGVPEGRVHAAGNLKYDVRAADEAPVTTALHTNLPSNCRVVVAGSTLEGEERMLLETWPRLLAADHALVFILAPRHPERFASVAQLAADSAARSGVPFLKRSDWMSAPQAIRPGSIFLLDSIGELASIYSLAAVAFVGGSLIPAGGHNPLEPAQFSVPVVMGSHYGNFRAIVETLRQHNAIRIASEEELGTALLLLLGNPVEAAALGQRGHEVFNRESGATERAVTSVLQMLGPDRCSNVSRPDSGHSASTKGSA